MVVFCFDREAPQLGTSGVSPSFKWDGRVVIRLYGHSVAVKYDSAAVIADPTYT